MKYTNKGFTLIRTRDRNLVNGFTLIELLVVIAVIGALAGVVLFGTTGVFETSRDTQRKSDLEQYRVALETYANNNSGLFPTPTGSVSMSSDAFCKGELGLSGCPEDPTRVSEGATPLWTPYGYHADASGTEYVIYAKLEKSTTDHWVVCSNGKSAQQAGFGGEGTCPIP